ncbi:Type I restriction enzyme R protein [Candidatus Fokinia solitaria]|uniref:Type I restriction enzyme endonuclease subunit n=1 Tax=Candidatus Fokinia solitaria TaxID=1802984 RepID=A0A2U8BSK3_9RICK|nr:type I restriction endonuclease subunit R [Candidatus Fokinia solitaria]AWD33322.1 Type I restriction enzyme R protein [Candidatus Fokinia solitaria]
MIRANSVKETQKSTVIKEYTPSNDGKKYDSEAEIEAELIRILTEENGYEYLPSIKNNRALLDNLRERLSSLNKIKFTDNEWEHYRNEYLTKKNSGVKEKTKNVQEDYVYSMKRDDGSTKNIYILNKSDKNGNLGENVMQVISQYKAGGEHKDQCEAGGEHKNRYDVTILVNGLPLVHIELKSYAASFYDAFAQIERYQRESFGSDDGLFEYVQIFVISNGAETKYYANNTPEKTKYSKDNVGFHEVTNWWTDAQNTRIAKLTDFARTFLSRHSLFSILTRYCLIRKDYSKNKELLCVLRPYQIAAIECILEKIRTSTESNQLGCREANGYIWHATGSGKTITSFKVAKLASEIDGIDKVLFVVDRKDLDYQTTEEYNNIEKDAVNQTSNTKSLERHLSTSYEKKIIITTLQKLRIFISKNKKHDIFNKHVILIFDECHRSHFGKTHIEIVKNFKKYHIFGFTGTPIFQKNSSSSSISEFRTTEDIFGQKLHAYTILNAISDRSVLQFMVDYCSIDLKAKDDIEEKDIPGIDKESAYYSPNRIALITKYIISRFDQKTKRNKNLDIEEKRKNGFNSIFAVGSIYAAIKYYKQFKAAKTDLNIALIYSLKESNKSDEDLDEDLDANPHESSEMNSNDFLAVAIKEYNEIFKTDYSISTYDAYYQNLSKRMKDGQIDLLIVVDMFLTGFDARTVNTLWLDRKLQYHNLIQAFSRTNRISSAVKSYGQIVDFRSQRDNTEDAICLFSNEASTNTVLARKYEDYYSGWNEGGKHHEGYVDLVQQLKKRFPLQQSIENEEVKREFCEIFARILHSHNTLSFFDDFEKAEERLPDDIYQDYLGRYSNLCAEYKKNRNLEKEDISLDITAEMVFVNQIAYNIDNIFELLKKYQCYSDKEVLNEIRRKIEASPELHSKRELIESFIEQLKKNADAVIDKDIEQRWQKYVAQSQEKELNKIIEEEKLDPVKTKDYMQEAFATEEMRCTGTRMTDLWQKGVNNFERVGKKGTIFQRLSLFFEKYSNCDLRSSLYK